MKREVVNSQYVSSFVSIISLLSSKKVGIELTSSDVEYVVKEVFKHYLGHKSKYGIKVQGIDPYKFVSWSSYFLLKKLKGRKVKNRYRILVSIITVMRLFLQSEGKFLDRKICQKILKMYTYDMIHDNYAIGKNGLYLSFRTASEVKCIN
jgi:hypothetical protein